MSSGICLRSIANFFSFAYSRDEDHHFKLFSIGKYVNRCPIGTAKILLVSSSLTLIHLSDENLCARRHVDAHECKHTGITDTMLAPMRTSNRWDTPAAKHQTMQSVSCQRRRRVLGPSYSHERITTSSRRQISTDAKDFSQTVYFPVDALPLSTDMFEIISFLCKDYP